MSKLNQITVTLEVNSAAIRTEQFLGREFCVVPAVLVRSQVLKNNLGATFLPAADITSEWAAQWNGIPVLVGPHPTKRGVNVSGRDPELWNERCAGWIFAAKAVQEDSLVRHLAGEVWLDKSRAESVDGLQAVLDTIAEGVRVELSTGFTAQLVAVQGEFQGKAYEAIMHPVQADHLVISTEMTGACSVSDGCGLGVNKFEGTPPMETKAPVEGEAEIQGEKVGFAKFMDKLSTLFSTKREAHEKVVAEQEKIIAARLQRELDIINSMSDHERHTVLRSAMQEKFGGSGREVIIQDIYSDAKEVVFWLMTPFGSEPQGPEYFRVSYSEGEGGAFNFGDPEKVRRTTEYTPVGNAGEPQSAANCQPCASHKEKATMSDKNNENAALDALTKTVGDLATAVQSLATDVKGLKDEAGKEPGGAALAGLKKTIGELAAKVDSMKGVTESAVQERERERQNLITSLAGNYRCAYDQAELEGKPLDELRKIAEMVNADYSGRGGPRGSAVGNSEQRFAEPVPYFQKKDGGK